jgi:hypothetical protein
MKVKWEPHIQGCFLFTAHSRTPQNFIMTLGELTHLLCLDFQPEKASP